MKHVMAVILAAGEGKRMKSAHSKVAHEILGRPLVRWVTEALREAGVEHCVTIVGHREDEVRSILGDSVTYARQEKQLGTGHAVMQAKEALAQFNGPVLVLCGDTPLLTGKTISTTLEAHQNEGNAATVITAHMADPTGYGRILRGTDGSVRGIVEHRDASEAERSITEINSGLYCFDSHALLAVLDKLGNNNSQGEYYLTDTLALLREEGRRVGACCIEDAGELMGINDRVQLAEAQLILSDRLRLRWMREGVTLVDPARILIGPDVSIGRDTVLLPGTSLEGKTCIGENCVIGPDSRLMHMTVGNGSEIQNSVADSSVIGDDVHVGPFAYIRPGSRIGNKVKIGDFVEIKNAQIGDKTKVSHLTYIGDADVGTNCNFGCGTVTVNYDGHHKFRTTVGDNAFVGCNSNLVAPVNVGSNSYVAAGSTITDEVPEFALAIARSRQTNKDHWVTSKGKLRKE